MKIPTLTGIGSMAAKTATQNVTFQLGPCNSGNLLIVMAGKRAASNFTFPTNWVKTEVASDFTAAVAYKWGALADSGTSIVVSCSAAGNLFHAVSVAFGNVDSSANPLNGLISEVWSRNYSRAGSLQPIGQALGVCCIVAFDNVAVTAGGMTAASWGIVNSHTTSTGSDGNIASFIRSFYLVDSGTQFNPNSTAGTAPRQAFTFYLRGTGEEVVKTGTSEIEAVDSFERAATIFIKIATSALAALDVGTVRRAWAVLVNEGVTVTDPATWRSIITALVSEGLTPFDTFTKDVVEGGAGGTVYPVTRTDTLEAGDALLRVALRLRRLESAFDAADGTVRYTLRARMLSDSIAPADPATWGALYASLFNEAVVVVDDQQSSVVGGGQVYVRTPVDTAALTDALTRTWQAVRMLGEQITPMDENRYSRTLRREVSEALAPTDEALRWSLRERIMAEALAAADDVQRVAVWQRQRDEAFTLADALVFHLNRVRLPEDALSLVDSFLKQGQSSAVMSDGLVLQDGALARSVRPRVASDLADVIDELRLSRVHGRFASEFLTVDDKRDFSLYLSRLDTVTVSDSVALTRRLVRVLTEALTLGDSFLALAGGVRVRVTDDQIELDDGVQRVLITRRVMGDVLVLDDPVIALSAGLRVRDMVDTLSATDGSVAGAARGRVLQSLVDALYDEAQKQGVGRWRMLSDALSPSDLSLKALARTILLADSLALDEGALVAKVSVRALWDVLELTDAYTKAVADALANILDVRILIDVLRLPVALGSYNAVRLGMARAPVLGGYN